MSLESQHYITENDNKIQKLEIVGMVNLLILISNHDLSNCQNNPEKCYQFSNLMLQVKDLYNTKKIKSKKHKYRFEEQRLKCKSFKLKATNLLLSHTNKDNKNTKSLA
ncbi:hypothetical protein PMAC_003391 [Pneumocystis sp. 'macacae']|nr:hypothetical protein PMAC_003391 [Pneumocystis sp. 'macacae']